MTIMALAAMAFAISAFVGATLGHLQGPDIVITAVWGLAAGLAVIFGQAPSVIGLQAVIGLVVFSQFSFRPEQAAFNALWALSGGALQIALVAATWSLQRFPVERQASSTAYHMLANQVRALAADPSTLLDPAALDELRSALLETQPWGDQAAAAAYQALADQAERIRLELAGIARVRAGLAHSSTIGALTEQAVLDAARELDVAVTASANLLAKVGDALHDGRSVVVDPADRENLRAAIEKLSSIAQSAERPGPTLLTQAVGGLTSLAGQLRTVDHMAAVAAGERPATADTPATDRSSRARWRPPPLTNTTRGNLESLRANLTLTSEGFRHALRVAVTMAMAVAISHLFPLGHGYWLPMTVMIVLKPDFAATLSRGLARSVGTLVGAVVVTLLVAVLRPAPAVLIALTVALYAVSIATLVANYVIYSVSISSLVVILLAFTGSPEPSLAADRAFYTILGAALALGAYVVWPTWERTRVADRLADLVETDGRYGAALVHAWADPAAVEPEALERLRLSARLARSNAEASVARWMSEPTGHGPESPSAVNAEKAQGILAAVRRYVWAALALHGQLPSDGPLRPDLDLLGAQVEEALAAVATALRAGSAAASTYPSLRATQVAFATRLMRATRDGTSGPETTHADMVLLSETDQMVNAVDTLAHLVGLHPQSSPAS